MINFLTEYAGFWRRFAAFLLDMLWLTAILWPLLYLSYGGNFPEISDNLETTALLEQFEWRTFLINNVLPSLLIIWFWIKYAATPGKWFFDCKVVDAKSGKPICFKQAILRFFSYFISALPLGLGFLWIIWDKRKQGWHDKIAKTVVIIHDEATIPLHQLMEQAR
ncbi:RDD family protein [Candidatus Parabeggiatoa sp. HSG14]|uniref:RDD family protein n=1 Tax=Candidatus Parabeggiatoa sp. HSG14 TaxID=3055593 RepID=UPI0025A88D51|nr:RDD family protein [Thiotrichales bacterium HSG14]